MLLRPTLIAAALLVPGSALAQTEPVADRVEIDGMQMPLPDLLIAATAVWLDVPLLTCDPDFARGRALVTAAGGGAWSPFRLHPASVT